MTEEALPVHWRVCDVTVACTVNGIELDPGWWTLGFPTKPAPSSTAPFPTIVDSPDGAIVAIRIHPSDKITENPRAPLRLILGSELVRTLPEWSARQLQLDAEHPPPGHR